MGATFVPGRFKQAKAGLAVFDIDIGSGRSQSIFRLRSYSPCHIHSNRH